jgi:hypothetical protein
MTLRAIYLPTGPSVAMLGDAKSKHGPWGTSMPYDMFRIHIKSSCDLKVKCHKRRYDDVSQ